MSKLNTAIGRNQGEDDIVDLADPDNDFGAVTTDSPEYRRRETSAWKAKVNSAASPEFIRDSILDEWHNGCYNALEAIFWLQTLGIIEADRWLHEYAQGLSAPIPSVSKSNPFQPQGDASCLSS